MFENAFDIIILVIGLMCSIVTGVMNMPLAWRVHKTNDTTSLSRWTLLLSMGSCTLWIIYSVLIIIQGATTENIQVAQWITASLPILICNLAIAFVMTYLLFKKIRNDRKLNKTEQTA